MNNYKFWNKSIPDVLQHLNTKLDGLATNEIKKRLKIFGHNRITPKKRAIPIILFLRQFQSPLILLLLFAAILSFAFYNHIDAVIILTILLLTALLSFFQERGANKAVEKLLSLVQVKCEVLRSGKIHEVSVEKIVPGDVLILNAGDLIPADCLLIESKDFFVDEATLTGESFGVEKKEGISPEEAPLSKRTNALFMGSHVISGTAKAVVVFTGKSSEFGHISEKLKELSPETSFEKGIKHFGYFLLEVTLLLVLAIFIFNIYLHRPILESFIFALALAVGLTPQLLPAIITINLSHGAKKMAQKKSHS